MISLYFESATFALSTKIFIQDACVLSSHRFWHVLPNSPLCLIAHTTLPVLYSHSPKSLLDKSDCEDIRALTEAALTADQYCA